MAIKHSARAFLAILMTSALTLAACGGGGEDKEPASDRYPTPVSVTWWRNAPQDGPGKTYWEKVAKDFSRAHPSVTSQIEAIETNQLQRTRLPATLLTSGPP